MAVFNPVMVKMETGLLVPGEEYMGFLPEKLDTVSGEMSSISFRPGTVNSGGGYIILQDYSNNYLVIPAVVKGETHEVVLTGSDSSRGAVICTYPSGRLSLSIINVSCKDASKPVSLYVKAYGYGRMGNKTVSEKTCTLHAECTNGSSSVEVYGTDENGFVTAIITRGRPQDITLLTNSTVALVTSKNLGASSTGSDKISGSIEELASGGSSSGDNYLCHYICKITGDSFVDIVETGGAN